MADYLLSGSEIYLMKVIWNSDTAVSMQQIMELVNSRYQKNWRPQTISVFLGRMVNKKMIQSERKGRVFYYTPTMSEEEYSKKECTKWVDVLGNGRVDLFVRSVALARGLSAEEREGLMALLADDSQNS